MGPYIITDKAEERGTYLLAELEGTELSSVYPGKRPKGFYPRRGIYKWDLGTTERMAAQDR